MSNLSAAAGTWDIDTAHTNLGFSARHAMVAKVRGHFAEYSGTFTIDGENIANSKAEITIQTASILTGQADRDGHLKSPDFLDVENFPTITFVSTAVAEKGDSVVITGDLTIHGVTKSVVLKTHLLGFGPGMGGVQLSGWEVTTTLDKSVFGVNGPSMLGKALGDEVAVTINVEADYKK